MLFDFQNAANKFKFKVSGKIDCACEIAKNVTDRILNYTEENHSKLM